MNLKILLPFRVFAEKKGVKRIVAESPQGSFGILPNRLDCVSVLVPGLLVYETDRGGEEYVAINEGIMVKTGSNVVVSVRNAVGGVDLEKLHDAVRKDFMSFNESEKAVRVELARLESGFVRRFTELYRI